MKPIGTYRFPAMQAPAFQPLVWGQADFYDFRRMYLPLVGKHVYQFLVRIFDGSLAWINISSEHVTFFEKED